MGGIPKETHRIAKGMQEPCNPARPSFPPFIGPWRSLSPGQTARTRAEMLRTHPMRHHGIHHVTAIAGPARRNLDFYTRALGLRLVKKTVNFDDPGTYHLYFGDSHGHPGSILTFFPWEHVAPGRNGVGTTQETAFRVPEGSLGFWMHRFIEQGVEHGSVEKRFGQSVLTFKDPHGTSLALVGTPNAENEPAWTVEGIPAEHAIRGLEGVTLLVENGERTGAILTDVFGFAETAPDGSLVGYQT